MKNVPHERWRDYSASIQEKLTHTKSWRPRMGGLVWVEPWRDYALVNSLSPRGGQGRVAQTALPLLACLIVFLNNIITTKFEIELSPLIRSFGMSESSKNKRRVVYDPTCSLIVNRFSKTILHILSKIYHFKMLTLLYKTGEFPPESSLEVIWIKDCYIWHCVTKINKIILQNYATNLVKISWD